MKQFIKIKHFTKGDKITPIDFEGDRVIEYLNTQQISSMSGVKKMYKPLSGGFVGEFVTITMLNKDKFFIDVDEHHRLLEILNVDR